MSILDLTNLIMVIGLLVIALISGISAYMVFQTIENNRQDDDLLGDICFAILTLLSLGCGIVGIYPALYWFW